MRMHTLNSANDLDAFFKPLHFLNRQPVYRKKPQTEDIHPLVDISENKQAFFIHAELPGVKQSDVKITVDKNVLSLSGKKASVFSKMNSQSSKSQTEDTVTSEAANQSAEGLQAQMVERVYGQFSRSFTLPESVDSKNMKAKFSDGVLTIEIPKKEEEIQRSFEVEIN